MKELVLKKMIELEEIYKSVHMDIDSDYEGRILNDLIDSGKLLSCSLQPEKFMTEVIIQFSSYIVPFHCVLVVKRTMFSFDL
jgi:hypothetical protein